MQNKQEEEEKTQNVKIRNTPIHMVLVPPTIRSLSIQYLPKTKQEAFYPSVRPSIHPPTICSHMVQMAVLTNFIRCKTPEFIV